MDYDRSLSTHNRYTDQLRYLPYLGGAVILIDALPKLSLKSQDQKHIKTPSRIRIDEDESSR